MRLVLFITFLILVGCKKEEQTKVYENNDPNFFLDQRSKKKECIATFKDKKIYRYVIDHDENLFVIKDDIGQTECMIIGWNVDKKGNKKYLCEREYWYDLEDMESFDIEKCKPEEYGLE